MGLRGRIAVAVAVAAAWMVWAVGAALAEPPLFARAVETRVAGSIAGFECFAEYHWMFPFDATSDGKLDLVAGPSEGCGEATLVPSRIDVLAGDGNGHFALRRSSLARTGRDFDASAAADIDGDGDADLVGVTARFLGRDADDAPSRDPRRVFVALSDGRGGFRASSYPLAATPVRKDVHPPIVGRFLGDHHLDIAVGVGNELHLLEGRGDGSLRAPVAATYSEAPGPPAFESSGIITAASFNRDGFTDVFFGPSTNRGDDMQPYAVALLAEGNGRFRAIDVPTSPGAYSFDVMDMNGDRRSDVVSWHGWLPGTTFVSFASPDGTFSTPRAVASRTAWAGELDGDGRFDRIVHAPLVNPSLRFEPGRRSRQRHGLPGWEVVAARHIDGDRRPDLLVRKPRRLVALLSRPTRRSRAIRLTATTRQGKLGTTCVRFRARDRRGELRHAAAVIIADLRVRLGRDGRGRTCDEFRPGLYDAYLVGEGASGATAVRIRATS